MDPVRNPYAPGAGNPPPELAGRQDVLALASTAVLRTDAGRPSQSLILVGLRGVGKTVLLNRIEQLAIDSNFLTIFIEAHEGKGLPALLVPGLRSALFKLSVVEKASESARRGLRVLKSFLGGLKISIEGVDVGIDAEAGAADSGDIEVDLPALMYSVALAAKSAGRPIIILVDELQYLSEKEFSALIMSVHRINQKNLPLLVVGAGLPQILGLAGNSKSYAERLFKYPSVGALERIDAISAIVNPAAAEGVQFSDAAVEKILELTQRYPYFIQQWAYEAWNAASNENISEQTVTSATELAIEELDRSFFKVRFDRCTPSEKQYMRALAELGPGNQRSGDIAEKLGVKSTSVAPTRSGLIKKGMIYSPSHGDTAFTVPLFDEYMKRAIPQFKSK
jgi:AAA ATPase domain